LSNLLLIHACNQAILVKVAARAALSVAVAEATQINAFLYHGLDQERSSARESGCKQIAEANGVCCPRSFYAHTIGDLYPIWRWVGEIKHTLRIVAGLGGTHGFQLVMKNGIAAVGKSSKLIQPPTEARTGLFGGQLRRPQEVVAGGGGHGVDGRDMCGTEMGSSLPTRAIK
jgi:hypothetical protein